MFSPRFVETRDGLKCPITGAVYPFDKTSAKSRAEASAKLAEVQKRAFDKLTAELGREPTPREFTAWGATPTNVPKDPGPGFPFPERKSSYAAEVEKMTAQIAAMERSGLHERFDSKQRYQTLKRQRDHIQAHLDQQAADSQAADEKAAAVDGLETAYQDAANLFQSLAMRVATSEGEKYPPGWISKLHRASEALRTQDMDLDTARELLTEFEALGGEDDPS